MTDYNILNRAIFDDKQIRHEVVMPPHLYEFENVIELGTGNVYWVRSIRWRFGYFDVGLPNAKKIELKPIKVSVANILNADTKPYPPFTAPKPVADKILFKVVNDNLGNNHQLRVEFFLDGVLVSPKPGQAPLSYKEMIGYIMLSADKKGEMAMQEAAVDFIDEKRKEMGLESLRDKLPMGLSTLAIPNQLKSLMLNNGTGNSDPMMLALGLDEKVREQPQPLALPFDKDGKRDKSAFIGDMLSACPDNCNLSRENIQMIADYMIEQGWRKITN